MPNKNKLKKTLTLSASVKSVVSKKDGKTYDFNVYTVNVGGIDFELKPVDNTVKNVLNQYFGTELAEE